MIDPKNLTAMNIKFISSESNDPWYNLALEEYLLNNLQAGEIILYLWQNDHTVVIGANQNPWKECNIKLLEDDGGKLARRMSGGGAVYHDLGNLNFTFILNEDDYDFDKQIKVIVDALAQLNIKAEFTGRNDIVIDGKKFSGNAFYYDGNKSLHHGTILLDCDFSMMSKYLQVSDKKIKSKGIDSVRSRVINIREVAPDVTIEVLHEHIKEQFARAYGPYELLSCSNLDLLKLGQIYDKYSSWDWRFGDTPEYEIYFSTKFNWGEISLGFTFEQGIISDVKVYSDAMDVSVANDIKKLLLKLPFDANEIRRTCHENKESFKYQEVIDWVAEEIEKL